MDATVLKKELKEETSSIINVVRQKKTEEKRRKKNRKEKKEKENKHQERKENQKKENLEKIISDTDTAEENLKKKYKQFMKKLFVVMTTKESIQEVKKYFTKERS